MNFVFEYRKKGSIFEEKLPGSGLLIYRIDQGLKVLTDTRLRVCL